MSASSAQPDREVMNQIRKRLIETGDWDRIQDLLRTKLEEAGWEDDLRDMAKERARAQATPNLQQLLAEIQPKAEAMVEPEIRKAVAQEIAAVLEREVEKA